MNTHTHYWEYPYMKHSKSAYTYIKKNVLLAINKKLLKWKITTRNRGKHVNHIKKYHIDSLVYNFNSFWSAPSHFCSVLQCCSTNF